MVIENQTEYDLEVRGRVIEPAVRRYTTEHVFDTIDIQSNIGGAEISIEYYNRLIQCYGQIEAFESEEIDSNGHKVIIVRQRDEHVEA